MEKISFEESIGRLEKIVKSLENGNMPVDESILLFQEGIGLVKKCEELLKNVQEQTTKIFEENGLADFKE
ncbi:MAG: exodeoxyribonuclease VII small subunit [Bacillales bacterium]|jgi:exodeoxyribonuclease VII small subunit|nr:exodeoxyribonuclease VII small subunit [Bacillales bacterium]